MTQHEPLSTPKATSADRHHRQEDRITTIRLRMAICLELEARGITTLPAIGKALGMPVDEATKLLNGKRWREGDVEVLAAAAARLGLNVEHR